MCGWWLGIWARSWLGVGVEKFFCLVAEKLRLKRASPSGYSESLKPNPTDQLN